MSTKPNSATIGAVIGDTVRVMVIDIEPNGELVLSKRQADLEWAGWTFSTTKPKASASKAESPARSKVACWWTLVCPCSYQHRKSTCAVPLTLAYYIGEEIEAEIIKIDAERKNIVVSRRRVLEDERKRSREELVNQLEIGDLREGVVKNITDFGAFIDLGGLDGLLHITDMSWGRVNHPSEVVKLNQEIEVVVLDYDAERNRISLGMKQKTRNPWEDIELRYPIGSVHHGEVVNLMNYGAFVKLEDGIEGLMHISEIGWGKQPTHPSEALKAGEPVEVMVLEINHDKQEISGHEASRQEPVG